jgi:hypothetical protein
MNQASTAAPKARVNRKRLLPLLAVLAIGVAVLVVAWLRPSPNVVFAVNANTSVLTVALPCDQELVWDLPPGDLVGRSVDDALSEDPKGRVTVSLYGGADARLVLLPEGRITVTFGTGEEATCGSDRAQRLRASLGGIDVDEDAEGYQYLSEPLAPATEDAAAFALPLVGQVILGENLPFGAGWSGATPLLQSGEYRARRTGGSAGEQNTYIEGSLDAGAVVDTLPVASDDLPASGFVQVGRASLEAQVYRRREISLLSYAGSPLTLSVPRWRVTVHSAFAQIALTVLTLLGGLVGLTLSWLEALPNHSLSRWIKVRLREEQAAREQQAGEPT